MNPLLKVLTLLSYSLLSYANQTPIGSIIKFKGKAFVERKEVRQALSSSDKILLDDFITTEKSSFIKLELNDLTTIVLGPESSLRIKKFSKSNGSLLQLVKGKFRAKVSRKVETGNTVVVKTELASLAIRGTEFLTNSYIVQGKSVTDTALLKGSIQTGVKGSSNFVLNAKEAFNTSALKMNKGITKLDSSYVEHLLKNGEEFLPNIQNLDGTFKDLNELFKNSMSSAKSSTSTPGGSAAGIGVGLVAGAAAAGALIGADDSDDKKEMSQQVMKPKKEKELDLSKLPWSIRDAILRKDELRENNECFYWFFKKIPGGGEKELFRRERDCDEFEYDL